MEIARTSRSKGPQVQKKLLQDYRKLLTVTRKVVNQAKRYQEEIASGVKRAKDTEAEGRISVLKRRHGLNCCRYRGQAGMQRWVGLGVIADNLINIGRFLAVANSG